MNFTKRDKTNMLLGLLGYVNPNNYENNYQTAYNLLENNNFNFNKIKELHYALKFDDKTETSFISLAGIYSTVKIKMSDIDTLIYYLNLHDVEIEVG